MSSEGTTTTTPTFRSRILHPDDGYTPRSLWELSLRAGIGAILSKKQWWVKWRANDTTEGTPIREKWLMELEDSLLRQTLHWTGKNWTSWKVEERIFDRFVAPDNATEEEKRRVVNEACKSIQYDLIWNQEEDDDEEDEDASKKSSEEFREENAKMESFGQVLWYMRLVLLNREFRDHEPGEWPSATGNFAMATEESTAMTLDLLQAVRQGAVTKDNFATWLPDADVRPHILDALWYHVEHIMDLLKAIRNCVVSTLEHVICENGLEQEGSKLHISDGPVAETWMSDSLIEADVKKQFLDGIAKLENVPDADKDWHPGSDGQVLNLIHPSMYCCVYDTTMRVKESPPMIEPEDVAARMHRICFGADEVMKDTSGEGVQFQWIPSDFKVDENGHVQILSYINNLHPSHHAPMSTSIAAIFEKFVPLFDRVLTSLVNSEPSINMPFLQGSYDRDTSEVPQRPAILPELPLQPAMTDSFTLKGKTAQVIVKIAEIRLTPEKPVYPGGAWHIEGTDAERIVSTGLYYFACENITESRLSFRVIVSEPDYQQNDDLGMASMYGLERDELLMQHLGAAVAMEDRCLVFPNTFQHKVEPFELADPSRPGVRKILAFFLVDPSDPVASTSVIPPQQESWLQEIKQHALASFKKLPDVAIESHIGSMLRKGMSLEEALQNRLDLMDERRPVPDEDLDYELQFSLCEHQ